MKLLGSRSLLDWPSSGSCDPMISRAIPMPPSSIASGPATLPRLASLPMYGANFPPMAFATLDTPLTPFVR